MTLQIGQKLRGGRYRIQGQLGQGGMGKVYLAQDLNLSNQLVAIKENIDTSRTTQIQFQREAETLARLRHPNLPRITNNFIETSGLQYLVMDYIDGKNLREILIQQNEPLPEKEIMSWLDQIIDALDYMHSWIDPRTKQLVPIIHRDIKPSNIKRASDGRIVLVDFGIAKLVGGGGTLTGARAYTPGFAPIEQYTGAGTDIRSDIYSLGATIYSLVTRKIPPEAPDIASGKATLYPPRALNPSLSRQTDRVIMQAMHIKPDERYQGITEMRQALMSRWPEIRIPTPRRLVQAGSDIIPLSTRSVQRTSTQHTNKHTQSRPQTTPRTTSPRRGKWSGWLLIGALGLLILWILVVLVSTLFSGEEGTRLGQVLPVIVTPISPTATPNRLESTATQAIAVNLSSPRATVVPTETATIIPSNTTTPTSTRPESTSTVPQEDLPGVSEETPDTATPVPSRTPTPRPTRTPTQIILDTVGETVVPTSTQLPTSTPRRTATPTEAATATPTSQIPPTSRPAQPVQRSVSNPSVTLLGPLDTVLNGRRTFRWDTNVTLQPNQVFEAVFWRDGQTPLRDGLGAGGKGPSRSVSINLDGLPSIFQSGQNYHWGILLVQDEPYERIQYLGGDRQFRFESSSGSSSTGGGNPNVQPATPTPRG